MPRRPAKVTQADIARAIRAAKAAGATAVTIDCEGIIRIALTTTARPIRPADQFDAKWSPSEALWNHLNHTNSG